MQATARPEHTKHLRDDFRLIHAEIEDPVRDNHVHGHRRHWQGVSQAGNGGYIVLVPLYYTGPWPASPRPCLRQ